MIISEKYLKPCVFVALLGFSALALLSAMHISQYFHHVVMYVLVFISVSYVASKYLENLWRVSSSITARFSRPFPPVKRKCLYKVHQRRRLVVTRKGTHNG